MVTNLPNILTLMRILLLPFFAATLIYKEHQYALALFLAGAVTDLLDGLIARITNQITYFGRILDPVADKFFLMTTFILMSIYELMPTWLTLIVISRDLIVVTGCMILYFVTNQLRVEPSTWGKCASACQFILIGLILISLNLTDRVTIPLFFFIFVAVLTSVSGIDYIFKGLKIANSDNVQ